jgi:ketosteroid isomerase-like protein
MVRDRAELARMAFEAFSSRDLETALAFAHPEIEFYALTGEVAGEDGINWEKGAYWGHDGLRRFFSDVASVWEELEAIPTEFKETGEQVLVHGRLRGRRKDGERLDIEVQWVWRERGGKISYWCIYTDRAEALAAVGLAAS